MEIAEDFAIWNNLSTYVDRVRAISSAAVRTRQVTLSSLEYYQDFAPEVLRKPQP